MTTDEIVKILAKHKTCKKPCDSECRIYDYRDKYCRTEVAFNMAIQAVEKQDDTEVNT